MGTETQDRINVETELTEKTRAGRILMMGVTFIYLALLANLVFIEGEYLVAGLLATAGLLSTEIGLKLIPPLRHFCCKHLFMASIGLTVAAVVASLCSP